MNKRIPRYTNHNGFLMPYGFPAENFDTCLSYKPEDTDIFVSTYPKCGTTWTQHIVYMIVNNGKHLGADLKLTEVFPHLEEVGSRFCDRLSHPRLIKTHLPYNMTPINERAKYIYVARNPKDCMISFYFHTKGFVNCYDCADLDFNEYIKLFLRGDVDFGDYFVNLKSWFEQREKPHILFITYEEIKEDFRLGILKIASFLGESFHENLLSNDEKILREIMNKCSFNAMRQDLLRWSSKRGEDHTPFIRRGIVGDWVNHLNDKQSDAMDSKISEELSLEDLRRIWPSIYDNHSHNN